MLKPKLWLQAEGAAVLLTSGIVYQQSHGSWGWFALLFLSPDLFMTGYLVNRRLGAAAYNLVHNYALPLLLLSGLLLTGKTTCLWPVLIWLAHIGMDRMLGFGLKYETAFKDTHLQRV